MNVLNHCSSGVIRASRISRISKGLWCWGGMGGAPAHIAFPSGWAEGCDEGALYTGEFLAFCTPFIAWFYGSSHFLFIGGSAMRQAWGGNQLRSGWGGLFTLGGIGWQVTEKWHCVSKFEDPQLLPCMSHSLSVLLQDC